MLRRHVGLYEQLPWWYGHSYQDLVHERSVCYPLGLHWVMRWLYLLWLRSIRYRRTAMERRDRELYQKGYDDGWECADRCQRQERKVSMDDAILAIKRALDASIEADKVKFMAEVRKAEEEE